jgi:hypothetical protein
MARTTALFLVVAMTLAAGNHAVLAETPECPARDTVPTQLRSLDCRTVAIVASGIERSTTFRRLIDRVGQLNGIVYIEDRYYVNERTRRVMDGALSHQITKAGAYRVLHLIVAPQSGDRRIVTMAHELQHAIEVLEVTDADSEAAVDRVFERIGVNTSAGVMETQAALDAERAVAHELSAHHQ